MSVVKYRQRCKNYIANIKMILICKINYFLQLRNCENCELATFYKIQFDPKYSNFGFTQNCGNLQG